MWISGCYLLSLHQQEANQASIWQAAKIQPFLSRACPRMHQKSSYVRHLLRLSRRQDLWHRWAGGWDGTSVYEKLSQCTSTCALKSDGCELVISCRRAGCRRMLKQSPFLLWGTACLTPNPSCLLQVRLPSTPTPDGKRGNARELKGIAFIVYQSSDSKVSLLQPLESPHLPRTADCLRTCVLMHAN